MSGSLEVTFCRVLFVEKNLERNMLNPIKNFSVDKIVDASANNLSEEICELMK